MTFKLLSCTLGICTLGLPGSSSHGEAASTIPGSLESCECFPGCNTAQRAPVPALGDKQHSCPECWERREGCRRLVSCHLIRGIPAEAPASPGRIALRAVKGRERRSDAGGDPAPRRDAPVVTAQLTPLPNQILSLIPHLTAQHKHKLPFAAEGKGQPDFLSLSTPFWPFQCWEFKISGIFWSLKAAEVQVLPCLYLSMIMVEDCFHGSNGKKLWKKK